MKRFAFAASIILFGLPVIIGAQTIEFKIKDVGIGTPYKNVLRQLGKPLSDKKGGENPCGGAKRILRYSGLKITLDESENKQNIVVLIEVTSARWELSTRIKVGATLNNVQNKFNESGELTKESGFDVLTYLDGDGAVTFYFRNKKLVKIIRDLNLC